MLQEEQTDLCIRRTHKFLQEAMIELITEKGFDAITVGDIAERAMINRATFYRHYLDKYDLVAKIFEETAMYLAEHMNPVYQNPERKATASPPEIWFCLTSGERNSSACSLANIHSLLKRFPETYA